MFSLLFLGIGCLFEILGIGLTVAMITGEMEFSLLAILGCVLMPIIFIVIGAVSLAKDLKERRTNKAIAKNGRTTYAKVVDIHDTAGVMVNGMMPHGVVVRYFDAYGRINNDMIKIEPESSHYGTISVGETLEIKELDGRCVLVRELENLPFEGSEMLIDPTVSVYGEGETLSVNCPVCGAVVNVARGGAAFCSHCGYKVRLDNDGKVMNNG
ncbi:MAG: hypothetical protein II641_06505 [Clostridiales bacterium]|nr:hypothetical protein [Clostridiales bacterium]